MKAAFKILFVILFVAVAAVLTNAQPVAPTNLTASQGFWGKFLLIKLSWKDGSNSSVNSVRFNVYRKEGAITDSGRFVKLYPHVFTTSWIDQFVIRGQIYSYFVTAVNKNGESGHSDTVQISLDSSITMAVATGSLKDQANNNPIIGGRISFIHVFGWGMTTTRTDSSGNFKVSLFPGSYILYSNAPGYISEYYNNAYRIFNASKISVGEGDSLNFDVKMTAVIAPQKFALSGSVKDSLGNPIAARIQIFRLGFNSRSYRYSHTFTDSSGNYSVNVRQGDTVIVFARAVNHSYFGEFYDGQRDIFNADRIAISGNVNNVNFILEHKPIYNNGISGNVQNEDSIGVQSVIFAYRLEGSPFHRRSYSTETDSVGNYSLTNLYPGKYILMVLPQGDYLPTFFKYDGSQTLRWREADSIMVDTSGVVSDIDFNVAAYGDSGANFVHGFIRNKSGNPLRGAIVFAKDDNGEIYSMAIADKNGRYTIDGLVPGQYSISSEDLGYDSPQTSTTSLDYSGHYSSSASFTMSPTTITSVNKAKTNTVQSFQLEQNYPNPFNPTTTISYQIPSENFVTLKIYNVIGQEVATLVNSQQSAGTYYVKFNGTNLASGIYLYQLRAGEYVNTKKLILLK
jgi:Carboxypeptidase regulatory-like domain/Secretion system C-terminal sorting domain